jgi:uncharacterized damage-inducible protein DinB
MSAISDRLLRHSAWANVKVYEAVQGLPDEALNSYIIDPEWTVGRILQHIVGGADWYVYCLTGAPWRDIKLPIQMSDVEKLKVLLSEFDEKIASQAGLPDTYLTIVEGEKSWQNLRSTVIAEAIYHAGEHRTQLIDALDLRSFTTVSLDDLDLWNFEKMEKSLIENQ